MRRQYDNRAPVRTASQAARDGWVSDICSAGPGVADAVTFCHRGAGLAWLSADNVVTLQHRGAKNVVLYPSDCIFNLIQ